MHIYLLKGGLVLRIYLIRHGETEYNRTGLIQGYGEVPLNDAGISQVTCLARRLEKMPMDRIYSSDLRRTAMTATIIASFTGKPLVFEPAFRERNPGELADKTHEEGMAFFTDLEYEPPGGESVPVFVERVRKAFDALVEREGDNDTPIAVVSHGMVCGAFLGVCLGWPREKLAGTPWPNACLTIADYDGTWSIDTLADDSHVNGRSTGTAHATGA